MNLKEYLFYGDISLIDFAKECDLSPTHLSTLMSGRAKASKKTCRRIEEKTDGRVTAENAFRPTKIPDEYK